MQDIHIGLLAVILGIAVGITVRNFPIAQIEELYIQLPGDMLALMIQCITPPVIFLNILIEIANLSPKPSKNIAVCIEVYFVLTTLLSIIAALILIMSNKWAFIVKPETGGEEKFYNPLTILDLLENVSPMSLMHACARKYKRLEVTTSIQEPNSTLDVNITTWQSDPTYVEGFNIMGLIVYGIMYGWSLMNSQEKNRILLDFAEVVNKMIKELIKMIRWYMPVGILSVVASYIIELDSWESIINMGKLMGMVAAGLLIHMAILLFLPLCAGCNPFTVIRGFAPALWSALIKSSRAKTLQCCEDRNKVDHRISRLMINRSMDGTTLYNLFAVVYIAQVSDITLDLSQLITIALTVFVTSITAGWLPCTVRTMCVLTAVELPVKEAAILLVVEALLGHLITVVNVLGDCTGMTVVQQLSKWELERIDRDNRSTRSSAEDDAQPAN